jgi:hypothetical protein
MENVLNEPIQVNLYFKEYLQKIISYLNISRNSLFIRYLNINKKASTYKDENTKGTFDHYNSGIYFDIYDYTPAFSISAVTNTSTDKSDMSGMIFDALGEITIYSINEPRIGDLINFPYGPSKSDEVFRVIQIDVSMYVKEIGIKIHKLTLEYAPLKDLSKLNILNNYVYYLPKEKNILQKEYISNLDIINKNKEIITSLKDNFSQKYELYYLTENKYAPLELNQEIYNFLSYEVYQDRFFDFTPKPFGVKNYNIEFKDKAIDISNGKIVSYINMVALAVQKI